MKTSTYKGKYYDVEYSIVNVSELEGALRLDAEYCEPLFIKTIMNLKKWQGTYLLTDKFFIKRGTQPQYINEQTEYITLNSVHILDADINFEDAKYITKNFYIQRRKYSFINKDILVNSTGVGTLGRVAYVYTENKKGIVDNHITRIRIKDKSLNLLPEYLFSFLRSKYGQIQIERLYHGTSGQIEIYPSDFSYLYVPIPSNPFQKFIEQLVLRAYEERQKTEKLYKQAEEILLEELGLKDWKPKTKKIKIGGQEFEEEENISIRMLSDVTKADRFDAEYWEPKHDEIKKSIKNEKYIYLSELFSLIKGKNLKYNRNGTKKVIKTKQLKNSYIDTSSIKDKSDEGISLLNKDLLFASMGVGSLGKIDIFYDWVYGKEYTIDSTLIVLRRKNANEKYFITPETLLVLFRLPIYQARIYRYIVGTSGIISIYINNLNEIPIPLINQQIQQKTSQLIQQSFTARENSKKLLEIAKRAVEIYIEKNEAEGQKYINEQLQKQIQ